MFNKSTWPYISSSNFTWLLWRIKKLVPCSVCSNQLPLADKLVLLAFNWKDLHWTVRRKKVKTSCTSCGDTLLLVTKYFTIRLCYLLKMHLLDIRFFYSFSLLAVHFVNMQSASLGKLFCPFSSSRSPTLSLWGGPRRKAHSFSSRSVSLAFTLHRQVTF